MNISPVLSENTEQCPKTLFLCLLHIYTLQVFDFFQLINFGSKNPFQLAHSGYQDIKIFGTKLWGGFFGFQLKSK